MACNKTGSKVSLATLKRFSFVAKKGAIENANGILVKQPHSLVWLEQGKKQRLGFMEALF